MTAPACNRCTHWLVDDHNDWSAKAAGMGKCAAAKPKWEIETGPGRFASESDTDQAAIDALRRARFYVRDGEDYHAELFTTPDFTCAAFDAVGEMFESQVKPRKAKQ